MTTQTTAASTPELTPLADFLAGVLKTLRPLPPIDLELTQACGNVLAEEARAPGALPAFDTAAIDGYAARSEDILGAATHRPVRLNVVGDLSAASWRPVRVAPGTCFAVAAGAPLPAAADVVVPPVWTDQGVAVVKIREQPKRGHGVRRTGDEIKAEAMVAASGTYVTPALVAVLSATGVGHVVVRPKPRVAVLATGDELVDPGRASQPGQVVDANSSALVAAAVEAGAQAYRVGISDDDAETLRGMLDDQIGQSDLIVTTGGTGTGPGDIVRRVLAQHGSVRFAEISLFPCTSLGYGTLAASTLAAGTRTVVPRGVGLFTAGPRAVGVGQGGGIPVICLPGDTGAALIGFEVVVRPVIQKLAGADPVFRPSTRAHLLETVASPLGLREFRPCHVSERRGGGYTAQPLAGGPYTLSGLAAANGLIVLGERVGSAAAGSTVDVLMLDRRR